MGACRYWWWGGGFEPSVDNIGIGCGVPFSKIIATEKMSWEIIIKYYIVKNQLIFGVVMPSKDFKWFSSANFSKYKGEYIVILNKKVIAHGLNAKIAYKKALKKFPNSRPILAKIPAEDVLIL